MKNLEDYHNLYNRVDVLLLTDVFENFRDICIKNYNLDPAHYYTAHGLAWDAALKTTKLRTAAANEFVKDFFKLMNNSVFGKTMENIRNSVDIKLVNDKKQAKKLSAKPNFNHCNIFSEDLVAIHMKKTRLVFNKPVYLECVF